MADKLTLTNAQIAELLAVKAEAAKMPAQKALRRASRKAFLWSEEAARLIAQKRSLQELAGVGPYIDTVIKQWVHDPPRVPMPPDIRSGFLTLLQTREVLARRPSWRCRLNGDLQMHTLWSDGLGSIEEMARAAVARGYKYIAITDHSKGLKIAGGIDERQLREQEDEIARVNAQLKSERQELRVLRSIELNITPQGEGDMEPESLRRLDVVLGCFHSSLRKKEDQTERYLAALRNPEIQILGHPRGRIYNFRMGLRAEWTRVFKLAAELDKAVEIDAYPDRQDLSLDLVKLAAKAGCRISLGTDSHGPTQLAFIDYALASALLGGVKPERILNFMTADGLTTWAAETRERSRHLARRAA
jgi:histidinol phosphatase-like PHP family hydrolase